MDGDARERPVEADDEPRAGETSIRAHESRPGRLVFTEEGHTDAWIATDLVVDPER